MTDIFTAARAVERTSESANDLIAIVGEVIFGDGDAASMQRVIDLCWGAKARLGISRDQWAIEMASRFIAAEFAKLPRPEPIVDMRQFALEA